MLFLLDVLQQVIAQIVTFVFMVGILIIETVNTNCIASMNHLRKVGLCLPFLADVYSRHRNIHL